VKRAVDRSLDDLFRGISILPFEIVNEQRSWAGERLTFSFTAKMGFLSSPMKGFVEVTDHDITVDLDLGLLEKLLSTRGAHASVEERVRGLLT
jgi:hypothetical protein